MLNVMPMNNGSDLLEHCWLRLTAVKRLSTISNQGMSGVGKVIVRTDSQPATPSRLIFEEAGEWTGSDGRRWSFSNTYRWSLAADHLRLEHLRYGIEQAVHLVDLVPGHESEILATAEPHHCGQDCYAATLTLAEHLSLAWEINGPNKMQRITTLYE